MVLPAMSSLILPNPQNLLDKAKLDGGFGVVCAA
jgi:hypothetical protein